MSFTRQRQTPLTARTVHHIVAMIGQAADLPFPIHPHMLRHATGYYLASQGHDTRAMGSITDIEKNAIQNPMLF